MKAIYFNAKTKTWKPVLGITNLEQAWNVAATVAKAIGWNVNDITKIEIA